MKPANQLPILPFFLAGLLVFLGGGPASAADSPASEVKGLIQLDLEELMEVQVTTASKKQETVMDTAAAVYVITQEDIRRTGVTTIPDALRMVPGLSVSQINSSTWSVTARGFNTGRFANKLLVMIDGRTVYTPGFAGTYWDVQDTVLEDIDRIEVIRGPGGSNWGPNAVNGIINIITKHSKDTQGILAAGGAGTREQGFGRARYGGKIGENTHFRGYMKYFDRDNLRGLDFADNHDDWQALRGGFRLDTDFSESNKLTFQGDYYEGKSKTRFNRFVSFTAPFNAVVDESPDVRGGNLLLRWDHIFSASSDMQLQFYFDRADRLDVIPQKMETYDVDFQHRFWLGDRNEIVWGLGHRVILSEFQNSLTMTLIPAEDTNYVFSAFVQDDIWVVKDQLRLTLGSKFLENSFTGFEIQPTARLLWKISEEHSWWASVTRAVQIPSLLINGAQVFLATSPPLSLNSRLDTDTNLKSENVIALETGYRFKPNSRMYFDLTGFYNLYDDVASQEINGVVNQPPLLISTSFSNLLEAETYGVELASQWQVADWWKVSTSFSWFRILLHREPGGTAQEAPTENSSPEYQFHVRSYFDLPYDLQLDTAFYYLDHLKHLNVPSQTRWDVRLGYSPSPNWEASLVIQNLLGRNNPEWLLNPAGLVSSRMERSIYGQVTFRR